MKLRIALSLLLLFVTISLTANTNVTIAWDTSLSMQDRDLEKEFNFLQNYFKKYSETGVTLLEFNNVRVVETKFNVSNGDWSAIKNQLSTSLYDGATSYDNLAAKIGEGAVFIFTDGMETLIRDAVSLPGKPYIINSSSVNDLENLQFLALSNQGRFVNLQQQGDKKRGTREIGYVGNVYSPIVEVEDIVITIRDTDKQVKPRKDGTYRISGNPGDILVVSAFGKTLTEKTLDRNRTLNLWVEDDIEQLDEVLLKKRRSVVEGEEETELGGRKASKRSVGYATSSVGEKKIEEYVTLADAVRGRFAGVIVGDDLSSIRLTRLTSNLGGGSALIILDGAPLPPGVLVRGIIQPQDVASIDILKGFAATNIYGSEGRNGVVLITSKAEAARRGGKEYVKEDPKNLYKGPELSANQDKTPNYIIPFEKEKNVPSLYTAYMGQRETYWDNTPLYLSDVYEYFANWDDAMAQQIAYNAVERDSDLTSLRSLLFTAYKLGNPQLALDIAYSALDSYPQQTQSYLDLAMAQKAAGNYQDALNRLLAIENGTANPVLDFTNLQSIADNEIRNLVQEHKAKLELSKIQVRHLKPKDLNARIVIDWSNHDAEFELTFINPDNLYTKWKHTLANEELIEQEVLHGFSQQEFEIDGGTKGDWTINVKYIGNKNIDDMAPTLLRCTIHHNIGTSKERTEEKIIRLSQQGSEQLLVKLNTK